MSGFPLDDDGVGRWTVAPSARPAGGATIAVYEQLPSGDNPSRRRRQSQVEPPPVEGAGPMNDTPAQADLDLEDVPVEGPDVPDVEDVPADYVLPGEVRDYPRPDDTTDEGGEG
jgi:hypothetical protein